MKSWFAVLICIGIQAVSEPVPSTISKVTVFADRARVTRETDLQLSAGPSTVELSPVPAWVDPASIRARISDGEVLDVETRREFLARTPDKEIQAAEDAVQELEDQMAALRDQSAALDQRRQQILEAKTFATRELPPEISRRDIPVAYFKEMADFVYDSTLEIDAAKREIAGKIRALDPKLQAGRNHLQELKQDNQLEQLFIRIRVTRTGAGTSRLSVTYELPGATWEPVHDARVTDGNQVRIISLARVRQTTGEDWDGARLSFSTRKPGESTRIPQLESLLLGTSRPANPDPFAGRRSVSSWSTSNTLYLGKAQTYNARLNNIGGKILKDNFAKQMETQNRSTRVFRQLAIRGTTALYDAEGVYTIRSNGDSVRVPLAVVEQTGTLRVLAAPEISANAARGIELVYAADLPLLPGEAALFLDGAYIGTTRLMFTGPGEDFILFAGSEDSLKITRKLNYGESELKRGRRTNVMKVHYDITVENTGDRPLPLRLADRVPVSNERDIEVDHLDIEPEVEPDQDGLLAWDVTIPAKSVRHFQLRYVVDYPADLRLQGSAPRTRQQAADPFGFGGGGGGGDQNLDTSALQILNLEAQF